MDTNRISVEEFINQKQLKLPAGLSIDSALVYFSVPGQASISAVDYLPKFDSVKFHKYSSILIPGASVIFKVFITGDNHKSFPVQCGLYLLFNDKKRKDNFFFTPLFRMEETNRP